MSTQSTQANSAVQQHTVVITLPNQTGIILDSPNGVGVSNNPADFPYADPNDAQSSRIVGATVISDPFNLSVQVRFANPA